MDAGRIAEAIMTNAPLSLLLSPTLAARPTPGEAPVHGRGGERWGAGPLQAQFYSWA